jgi:uncharacterized Tic20 family protein
MTKKTKQPIEKDIPKNSETEKLVIILTHLGGIFFWIFPALIVYLVSEGGVKSHVKNALNWQLSLILYAAIIGISAIFLFFLWVMPFLSVAGVLFIWLLPTLNTIFCIIAAIKASQDKEFVYPMSIKFLKG